MTNPSPRTLGCLLMLGGLAVPVLTFILYQAAMFALAARETLPNQDAAMLGFLVFLVSVGVGAALAVAGIICLVGFGRGRVRGQ